MRHVTDDRAPAQLNRLTKLWGDPFRSTPHYKYSTWYIRLALFAGLVGTKLCAGCGSYWSRLAFWPPEFVCFGTTPPKHEAEPRGCCPASYLKSHPTVGVALFGSNVSEPLSSSREELPVS